MLLARSVCDRNYSPHKPLRRCLWRRASRPLARWETERQLGENCMLGCHFSLDRVFPSYIPPRFWRQSRRGLSSLVRGLFLVICVGSTSPGAQARGARGGEEVGKVATLRVGGSRRRPDKEGCCRKGCAALLPLLPPFQVDSCAMD